MEFIVTIDVDEAKKLQQKLEQALQLQQKGELDEAVKLYQEILNRIPQHPDALHLLGVIMYKRGNFTDAASMIKKSISVSPKIAQYHNSLGMVMSNLGQHEKAIICYVNALDLDPGYLEAQDNLLLQIRWSNNPESIADRFKKNVDDNKDNPYSYHFLARAYQRICRFDDAILNFEKAIACDPDFFRSYIGLASGKKITEDDKDFVNRMVKLASANSLSERNRSRLFFAIGKAYDDLGDYEAAFNNYDKANKIRKSTFNNPFDRPQHLFYITRIKSAFTKAFLDRHRDKGSNNERPVFIVGLPRSGKTLVEQVLSHHGNITGVGEVSYIPDITKRLPVLLQTSRRYPRCISRINNDVLCKLADKYLELIAEIPDKYIRVIDTLGANYLHVGFISMMFNNAKVIHCHRNVFDECLLLYFTDFETDKFHQYTFDLSDIGYYYRLYNDLMSHWRKVLSIPILEISYEEHMDKQTSMLKDLTEFCGLDWNTNCSEYYNQEKINMTSGFWQVRQDLYQPSIGKWKNYEKYLQPLKDALQI